MVAEPWPIPPERTGWRDEEISTRHRHFYGFNCPAVDIDFLMVEYNQARPAALVDYKKEKTQVPQANDYNRRALCSLANAASIPFFYAVYWPRFAWTYRVYPINDNAFVWFDDGEWLTELAYVRRLYGMRRQELVAAVSERLFNDEAMREKLRGHFEDDD